MSFSGINFGPLERGMDALVRMADALEKISDTASNALMEYQDREQ